MGSTRYKKGKEYIEAIMKYRKTSLLVLLAIIGFAFALSACHRSSNLIQYETKSFEKGEAGCVPKKDNCTYLIFQYPRFTQAKDSQVLAMLNQEVQSFLLGPVTETKPKDLEEFATDLFAEHQKATKEFPLMPQVWDVERTVKVDLNLPQVLALEMRDEQYLGGAHPNSTLFYANFNPATGAKIKLADLFISGYEDKLTALAEKKFREKQEIPAGQNLEAAGYFFEKGKFKLPDNVSIGPSGLIFYFNPYEAAAYVVGPIQFEISYAELKDLLRPEGVGAWIPPRST